MNPLKKIFLPFAVVLSVTVTQAQTTIIVHDKLSAWCDKIPVCQTPQASHTVCYENGVCKGDKGTAGFDKEFAALMQSRTQLPSASQQQAQMDLAQQMQDPAYQEKIKNMSIDEQIKLSQQLTQQISTPTTRATSGVPSNLEKQIGDAHQALIQTATDFGTKAQKDYEAMLKTYNDKFAKLDKDMESEIKACPVIGGEGDYGPDPACERPIRHAYGQKNIAMMNEMITAMNNMFSNQRAQIKTRYATIENLLVQSSYGDNVKIQAYYDMLTTAQTYIISDTGIISGETQKLFEYACNIQNKADQLNAF